MVENENRASNTKEVKALNTESKSLSGSDISLLVVIGILALICLFFITKRCFKEGWMFCYFIKESLKVLGSLISTFLGNDDGSTSEGGSRKTKRKSKRKLYKNKKSNKNTIKNKK